MINQELSGISKSLAITSLHEYERTCLKTTISFKMRLWFRDISSVLIYSRISYIKNMVEPVRSQQFLVKRDCDSETGLVSSPILFVYHSLLQTVRFSCLSIVKISFSNFSIVCLFKTFSLTILLSSKFDKCLFQSFVVDRQLGELGYYLFLKFM